MIIGERKHDFMEYDWLEEFLLSMQGVEKLDDLGTVHTSYRLADKIFATVSANEEGKPTNVACKVDPCDSAALLTQYEGTIVCYQRDGSHWYSIIPKKHVPDEVVRDLLKRAYELTLKRLPEGKRKKILNGK